MAAQVPGAPPSTEQELIFSGERCEDARRLKHYGVCENWIVQVAGFVVAPRGAADARKYVDGVLVPLSTPEPDWDAYPAA